MLLLRPLLGVVLTLGLSTAPGSAVAATATQVEGSGSFDAVSAVQGWQAAFQSDRQRVVYTPRGARAGRIEFASGRTDFAVTELPLQAGDVDGDAPGSPKDRQHALAPILARSLSLTYHLTVDGQRLDDLKLSEQTVADIFTGRIVRWDDPAIRRDNEGRTLPATAIVPVVRADEAADTHLLTSWFARRSPESWADCSGLRGPTSNFPLDCGRGDGHQRAAHGAGAVLNVVKSAAGEGTIGYVDSSLLVRAGLPTAAIDNVAGEFVLPTRFAVWTALREATIGSDGLVDLASVIDSVAADAYPLSAATYAILPTGPTDPRMSTEKRQALVDFFTSAVCSGQGRIAASGYAPLPLNATRAALRQISDLGTADRDVDLSRSTLELCANPTFDPSTGQEVAPAHGALSIDALAVDGDVRVGSRVRASFLDSDDGATHRYAWAAGGRPIAGATSRTFVPRADDLGKDLTVTVTARRPGLVKAVRTSPSVGPVVAARYGIRRPAVKLTRAPTREHGGRATITVRRSKGTRSVDAQGAVLLSMRLGSTKVTRYADVRFKHGVGTVALPRLRTPGRWRATVTVLRADVFTSSQRSAVFRVTVRR